MISLLHYLGTLKTIIVIALQAYFLQFILDEGDRDNHSVTSSFGETNDSAASSPYSTHLHSNEASRTSTAPKIPVNPLQINTTGTGSAGDDGGHAINTSPIKRRASQAEELLKAQDAGGMIKIQFPKAQEVWISVILRTNLV